MDERMIGKLFKILPIFETNKEDYETYLSLLITEMSGEEELNSNENKVLIILRGLKRQQLNGEELTHKEVKSTIFRCINLMQKEKEG